MSAETRRLSGSQPCDEGKESFPERTAQHIPRPWGREGHGKVWLGCGEGWGGRGWRVRPHRVLETHRRVWTFSNMLRKLQRTLSRGMIPYKVSVTGSGLYLCWWAKVYAKTTCSPVPTASKPFPGTPAPVPPGRSLLSPREAGIRVGQGGGTAGLVPECWQKALSFHPMPFDT